MNDLSAYGPALLPSNDVLVEQHAQLVKRIAYHLVARLPSSVVVDDLIQAGMIGLLDAARQYRAVAGASFETYARTRIRGAMWDEIRRNDWAPRSVHRKARDAAAATRLLEERLGRDARPGEIAAEMGISDEEYGFIVQDAASCRLLSLDELTSLGDAADDALAHPGDDPAGQFATADLFEQIVGAIDQLPERERLLLSLYYEQELNMREIGAVLGVSESRVCQIHGQAMVRLRARLGED